MCNHIGTALKISLILNDADLVWFAAVTLFESVLLCSGLVVMYWQNKRSLRAWRYTSTYIFGILRDTFPLIITGAIFVLFTKIDQVMLGSLANDDAVGQYTAALKISEGWMVVPIIISTSLFPSFIEARKESVRAYQDLVKTIINIMVALSLGVAIFFTITSFWIIDFLYGVDYSEAANVLAIHSWAMVFNTVSAVSFRYFLIEGLQRFSAYRALIGLVINCVLNLWLIPLYGMLGAAFSTLIAQCFAAFILNFISPLTREMFWMQCRAIFLLDINKSMRFLVGRF